MALPQDGGKRELLQGEIITSPAGSEHGMICVRIVVALEQHIRAHQIGMVFESSTGFRLALAELFAELSFARGRATARRLGSRQDSRRPGANG